jgi:hypothetical protein
MAGGNNGQDGFSNAPFAWQKIVVQPPTIFCHILHVLPSSTAPGCRWTVTVADRQGATVTVDIDAKELQTYERFQAALLRETGSPFRYLPVEPQTASMKDPPAPVSDVAAAAREKSAEDQALRASHTGNDAPAPVPAPAPPPSRGTLAPIHPLSA